MLAGAALRWAYGSEAPGALWVLDPSGQPAMHFETMIDHEPELGAA
jgi:hypothetical protein